MGRLQDINDWARYRNLPDSSQVEEPELRGAIGGLRKRFYAESAGWLSIFAYGYGAAVIDLINNRDHGSVAANLGIALVGTVIGVESVTETWGRHNLYRNELRRRSEPAVVVGEPIGSLQDAQGVQALGSQQPLAQELALEELGQSGAFGMPAAE